MKISKEPCFKLAKKKEGVLITEINKIFDEYLMADPPKISHMIYSLMTMGKRARYYWQIDYLRSMLELKLTGYDVKYRKVKDGISIFIKKKSYSRLESEMIAKKM